MYPGSLTPRQTRSNEARDHPGLVASEPEIRNRPPTGAPGLVRGLDLTMATAIVVGTMIGTGIFLKPAEVAREAGAIEWALAAWVVGGGLSLLGALCYAELATMMPEAGADYAYLRRAWGPAAGFLYGWKNVMVSHPASTASLASGAALFLGYLWPEVNQQVGRALGFDITVGQGIAVGVIGVMTLVNLLQVSSVGRVQTVLTALKVVSLAVVIGAGAWAIGGADRPTGAGIGPVGASGGFLVAVTATLWAYSGWHTLLRAGSEVKDPGRNLPRAMVRGFLLTAGLFLALNLVCYGALGFGAVAASSHPVSDLLELAMGPAGATVLTVMMLVSVVGSLNASMMASARVPYAMARDGLFPPALAKVDPDRRVPTVAVGAPSVLAAGLVLTGTFEDLTALFVFSTWLFYGVAIAGLIRLRHTEPGSIRPARAPGYPWLPGLFVVVAAVLTVTLMWRDPVRAGLGTVIMLAGLPAYWWMRRRTA